MVSKENKNSEMTKDERLAKNLHVSINLNFLSALIGFFTFIIAFNSKILQQDFFLAAQLVVAMPLFIYSVNARVRNAITPDKILDRFGTYCFDIGYGFFINSLGIIAYLLVSQAISLIFFISTILFFTIYTVLVQRIYFEQGHVKLKREILRISIIVFLGLFHVIGFY